MGCFNTTGFHSNLPITADDEIFAIICLKKNEQSKELVKLPPCHDVTPIFLPIFGKYNDYGNIYQIQRNKVVSTIEHILGNIPIENIMESIQDIMWNKNYRGKGCEAIETYLRNENIDINQYTICYVIDHKFVYDEISILPHDMDISYLNKSKSWELTKEYLIDDFETYKKKTKNDKVDYFMWKDKMSDIVKEKNFTSLNPHLKGYPYGWLYSTEYYDANLLLFPYINHLNELFDDDIKTNYISFIAFYRAFLKYEWEFKTNVYGGQSYNHKHMIKLYQSYINFLKKKIENETKEKEVEEYDYED